MSEQLLRLNSIVFMILLTTEIPPILHILLIIIFLFGEATAKSKEDISELTLK